MQIVENWTDLTGVIVSVQDTGEPRFVSLEVAVEDARPVEGFANLLGEMRGRNVMIHVPRGLASGSNVSPGQRIACRVRRAAERKSFVHPEHFSLG